MFAQNSERGQVLILVALGLVGLISLVALAVDGGSAFADRRSAQNAADTAAFAAAHAFVDFQPEAAIAAIAEQRAAQNGYTTANGDVVTVSFDPNNHGCVDNLGRPMDGTRIIVDIFSTVDTNFANIVGVEQVNNRVQAVTRACRAHYQPFFDGNAVVGLNPNTSNSGNTPCGFDTGGNTSWSLTGGGLFTNGCAARSGSGQLNLEQWHCITTTGGVSGFGGGTCVQPGHPGYTMAQVIEMMPPLPACDGTPQGGIVATPPTNQQSDVVFTNGVYCIDDFDAYDRKRIYVENATLYVRDASFDLQFSGGGSAGTGFSGYASTSGPYAGYFLLVRPVTPACERFTQNNSQRFVFRGNGNSDISGSIFAPTACIDFRGNPNGRNVNSQLVGYTVTGNGGGTVSIHYQDNRNAQQYVPPLIQLLE
jgi:Tfp pilus assembly protein PilX